MKNNYFLMALVSLFSASLAGSDCSTDDVCCQDTVVECAPLQDHNFMIKGEFLWWKTRISNIPFAETENTTEIGLPVNRTLKHARFGYAPGFRISFDYRMPCTDYDFFVAWTRFNQKANKTITADDGTIIQTVWDPFGFILAETATVHARQKLQLIDTTVGRTFFRDCPFSLRYYFGLRGGTIRHTENIIYSGIQTAEAILSPITVKLKSNFDGLGLLAGVNAEYRLAYNFGLFGKAEMALLAGKFKTNQDEFINFITDTIPNSTINSNLIDKVRYVQLNFALNAGIKWDTSVWCDRLRIGITAGYEFMVFPKIVRFTKLIPGGVQVFPLAQDGDATFMGLILGGFIEF